MTVVESDSVEPIWRRGRLGTVFGIAAVPVASVFLALVAAALIILVSSLVRTGSVDWTLPIVAYGALLQGSLGSESAIYATILQAAPLVLGGLGVGVGFKAGLFNIGGQGQFLIAATAAAGVGAALATAPGPIAISAALLAGMLAGAAWGWIPGALKAWSGAHEVVTTIMLNSIAASVIGWLILGPLLAPGFSFGRTGDLGSSALPVVLGGTVHLGVLLAVVAVPVVWWLLYRSTLGFEIRSVGANPSAARYAGMRPAFLIMLTMSLSGLLFGIAGSTEILGVSHFMTPSYGTAIGFDAIAVALLGRSHPFGIAGAAILFGALRAGAGLMQIVADIPVEIVDVIQAIILLFLAADVVIRHLFRIRAARGIGDLKTVTSSYAGRAR
ncbi:MAG TPA: ABC transporter permease [Candidatus Limnocylindrales bacterium]|nr:ABC transporter permease [Candidatus Limnocylindrales bacterium]